jgi:AhpD family alkylhydroperoxidase
MPLQIWARRPWGLLYFLLFYTWLDRRSSPLDAALRSLIQVRVSQINHCSFCVDLNSHTLLERGVSERKLSELSNFRASELFSNSEKLFLTYTEQMTFSDQRVADETTNAIRMLIDENTFVELNALIAFQNLSAKFNAALDIPPEGLCSIQSQKGV